MVDNTFGTYNPYEAFQVGQRNNLARQASLTGLRTSNLALNEQLRRQQAMYELSQNPDTAYLRDRVNGTGGVQSLDATGYQDPTAPAVPVEGGAASVPIRGRYAGITPQVPNTSGLPIVNVNSDLNNMTGPRAPAALALPNNNPRVRDYLRAFNQVISRRMNPEPLKQNLDVLVRQGLITQAQANAHYTSVVQYIRPRNTVNADQPSTINSPGLRAANPGTSQPQTQAPAVLPSAAGDQGAQNEATPYGSAAQLLARVAQGESGGRDNVGYGGATFQPTADGSHPGAAVAAQGPAGQTHAAGRYQFQPATWDRANNALGGNLDFNNAQDQDRAAWWLAQNDYARNTNGRSLASDIGSVPASQINQALASTWTSLGSPTSGGTQMASANAPVAARIYDYISNTPHAQLSSDIQDMTHEITFGISQYETLMRNGLVQEAMQLRGQIGTQVAQLESVRAVQAVDAWRSTQNVGDISNMLSQHYGAPALLHQITTGSDRGKWTVLLRGPDGQIRQVGTPMSEDDMQASLLMSVDSSYRQAAIAASQAAQAHLATATIDAQLGAWRDAQLQQGRTDAALAQQTIQTIGQQNVARIQAQAQVLIQQGQMHLTNGADGVTYGTTMGQDGQPVVVRIDTTQVPGPARTPGLLGTGLFSNSVQVPQTNVSPAVPATVAGLRIGAG